MDVRGNHLILFVSLLFPCTMTITFTMAVAFEHVYPVMPFMSYTGDLPVESCVFSMGLNLIAAFYIIIMYIRYNQIERYCQDETPLHIATILRLNKNSFPWGIIASTALSVTGSFQEINVALVHRLAALTCTYTGFVYMWYQTILSDLLSDKVNSRRAFLVRLCLAVASTVIHIVAPVLVTILDLTYPKCHEETLVWSNEEDGWQLHVCCSFLEWSIFFINVTYMATFYEEYKDIQIKQDRILFGRDHRQDAQGTTAGSETRKLR